MVFTVVDENQQQANASSLVAIHHLLAITLVGIDEDDTTSEGKLNSVAEMLAGTAPPNAANWEERAGYGIVVTSVDDSNGVWQYSLDNGVTFQDIGNASTGSGLLLPGSDAVSSDVVLGLAEPWNTTLGGMPAVYQGLIRFVPSKDFHGTAQMGFSMWNTDLLQLPAGSRVDTRMYPVSLNDASALATITVSPVNDQPVLLPGGTLDDIVEEERDNVGVRVIDIIGNGLFLDTDFASPVRSQLQDQMGLAITGVDRRHGDWLWSCADADAWYQAQVGSFVPTTTAPDAHTTSTAAATGGSGDGGNLGFSPTMTTTALPTIATGSGSGNGILSFGTTPQTSTTTAYSGSQNLPFGGGSPSSTTASTAMSTGSGSGTLGFFSSTMATTRLKRFSARDRLSCRFASSSTLLAKLQPWLGAPWTTTAYLSFTSMDHPLYLLLASR